MNFRIKDKVSEIGLMYRASGEGSCLDFGS